MGAGDLILETRNVRTAENIARSRDAPG
jgi:hypothetical protein